MSEQETGPKRRAHRMTIGTYRVDEDGTRTEIKPTEEVCVRTLVFPSTIVLPPCTCRMCRGV